MFYSTELLSLKRKGKLAKCWLAATFSEKMFKKTCRPILIKKINVVLTCEEILSTIEMRSGRNYGRFSLYLSSQLMYGAAKILLYQTKYFQDYVFAMKCTLFEKRRHEEFNAITALELPDVPPMKDVFRNLEIPSNLHLITEEPCTSVIGRLMQDEMYFGILSEHDMEQYLAGAELSLSEIRRFPWDQSAEIREESVQVPFVDVNRSEIEAIETERETRVASAENDQRKFFIVSEGSDVKKPAISRKRTLKSPTEIPAKRSKVSSVEDLTPQLPIEPPSPLIVKPPSAPELLFQLQQGLQVFENIELTEVVKPKKTRKFFDEQTQLSGRVMRKYIRNVSVHTRPLWRERSMSILLPGTEYLRQPSTKIANKLWGKTLNKFFSRYLIKPLAQAVQDEFQDVLDFEIEQTTAGETLRVDALSRLPDQTDESSLRKLLFTTSEITDQSKTLEKILRTENLKVGKEVEPLEEQRKKTKKSEETLIDLPEITGFEEKIGERTMISEKSTDGRTAKSSSSSASKIYLTKKELLALMEIHWNERTFIKFHDIISPENCNKLDAASTFGYCLEFHAEKIIILKQAEPFDVIWIQKYPYYTSGSGNSIATTS